MRKIHGDVKVRIMELDIRQETVAAEAGYDVSTFSRIIRGRQATPSGFEERVKIALDCLEAAERAAQEARQRVLRADAGVGGGE